MKKNVLIFMIGLFGIQPENEVPREAIFQESFETSFPATGWTQHIVYSGTL